MFLNLQSSVQEPYFCGSCLDIEKGICFRFFRLLFGTAILSEMADLPKSLKPDAEHLIDFENPEPEKVGSGFSL